MLKLTNDLLEENKKLVYSIANMYSNKDNFEDLYQVGMIAMLKAAEKYDKNKNTKFSTYAYLYIVGEIKKYISEDRTVKPSREVINNYIKIKKAKEYIYLNYGRNVSNEELSKLTGIDKDKIYEIETACIIPESLDSYINDEENIKLHDIIGYENNIENLIDLKDAISSLSSEEKEFIFERYYNDKTQTEIAKEKNTSQVRIYRYERKVLDKLKDKIAC